MLPKGSVVVVFLVVVVVVVVLVVVVTVVLVLVEVVVAVVVVVVMVVVIVVVDVVVVDSEVVVGIVVVDVVVEDVVVDVVVVIVVEVAVVVVCVVVGALLGTGVFFLILFLVGFLLFFLFLLFFSSPSWAEATKPLTMSMIRTCVSSGVVSFCEVGVVEVEGLEVVLFTVPLVLLAVLPLTGFVEAEEVQLVSFRPISHPSCFKPKLFIVISNNCWLNDFYRDFDFVGAGFAGSRVW